jgi:hypothetical protein
LQFLTRTDPAGALATIGVGVPVCPVANFVIYQVLEFCFTGLFGSGILANSVKRLSNRMSRGKNEKIN